MFVAASTRCFAEKTFPEACEQLSDLEYDKIELWFDEQSEGLKPSLVAPEPDRFFAYYRELTRLTPIALCLEHDVDLPTFSGLSKLAKLMRVTQITIPASPLGTPFNTEIDRLREFQKAAGADGVRISIKSMAGHLTEDPHTAVELCQSVRGLGITLDPSYYMCGSEANRSYDQVFPYVYHMHLRDSTAEKLQVPVGLGEIDYARLISQLKRQNYARALSVELLPAETDPQSRPLEMRKMRMLLETLL